MMQLLFVPYSPSVIWTKESKLPVFGGYSFHLSHKTKEVTGREEDFDVQILR